MAWLSDFNSWIFIHSFHCMYSWTNRVVRALETREITKRMVENTISNVLSFGSGLTERSMVSPNRFGDSCKSDLPKLGAILLLTEQKRPNNIECSRIAAETNFVVSPSAQLFQGKFLHLDPIFDQRQVNLCKNVIKNANFTNRVAH